MRKKTDNSGLIFSKVINLFALLLFSISICAQSKSPSIGLNIGHNSEDSLKVARLSIGIVTVTDSVKGFQFAPLSNIAANMQGLQLGGFTNVAYNGMKGIQISTINNVVVSDVEGLQTSIFSNLNHGVMKGLQISTYNHTDTLRGVQIGLVNSASASSTGWQIGLVNFTRDTATHHLGLFNASPHTRIDVMGYGGTNSKINMAIRLRNSLFYNTAGVGTHYMGLNEDFSGALFYRIGLYKQLTPRFSISGDAGFFHIETFESHSSNKPHRLYSLETRINADYQLTTHLSLFGTIGYGDTRYYSDSRRFRNRMLGELGLAYRLKSPFAEADYGIDPVGIDKNRVFFQDSTKEKPNYLRAAAMVTAVNVFVQRWDAWVLNEDFAKISIHSIKNNFKNAFVWDNDNFNTNLFAHPYHGNLYFNSARSNNLNYWQSIPYAICGSLMWEFFGEITPPAINDLMATSIGGTCIGETTFRISDMFLDDSKRGFSRVSREIGCALVSPMKGFKRLITGEAWRVRNHKYHDYSRIPVNFYASVGSRYLADDNALFRGEHNPFIELGLDYGDAFDDKENKPFDYMCANVTFGLSPNQPLINRLNLLGRIWAAPIYETKKLEADFGIFQHFNFYNSEAVLDGTDLVPYRVSEAASLGPGFLTRYPALSERLNLEHRIFISGILLGGSLSDYLHIQERDYNMGSGFSAKTQTKAEVHGLGYFMLDANYFRIFTWKGYDAEYIKTIDQDYTNTQGDPGNTALMVLNTGIGTYLSRHFSFDIKGSYFFRKTHYRYLPDISAHTFEIKGGLTYRL